MMALCLGTGMSYNCIELSLPLKEIIYFLPRNVIVCYTFIFHVAETNQKFRTASVLLQIIVSVQILPMCYNNYLQL